MNHIRFLLSTGVELTSNLLSGLPLNVGQQRYVGDQRLDDRVAIVTGGNSGIGKETARELVKRGAKVIIGCRDQTKSKLVVDEFLTQMPDGQIEAKQLDLSSLDSIRRFAKEVSDQEPAVDLLINNAGVTGTPVGSKTSDGFELIFGTNHLGHFLLTLLLLDKLKSSQTTARIIVVTGALYKIAKLDFDDIEGNKPGNTPISLYSRSKLANVLFAVELANRLADTNIRVYTVHPGVVKTELLRNEPNLLRMAMSPFQITSELGAQTILHCALSPDLVSESGRYYFNLKEEELWENAKDEQVAKKLWNVSAEMVKLEKNLNLPEK